VEDDIKPLTEADTLKDYSCEVEEVLIDVALQTKQFNIIKQIKDDNKADR
jgi:hypothetical protein